MENIEEHCEDTDTENTPLIKSASKSAPLPNNSAAASNDVTSEASGSAGRKDNQSSFAKFSATFANNNKFPLADSSTSTQTTNSTGPPTRMPHLHKLEKKHSSGDLHSRLKTRKLLGVGETDDGDIHRSKLSQILGHSDQLYIRLPYGLRVWQLIMACMFTFIGTWALILPSHLFNTSLEGVDNITLPVRLYGGALISLSIVYWVTLSSQDRDIIRMCLLTSIVYFAIQFLVSVFSSTPLASPISSICGHWANVGWRAAQILGSLYFYVVLTRDLRHYR